MAYRQFEVENLGKVNIYKRRGARSLRLTVNSAGQVRCTIPAWAPYKSGVKFAESRAAWLKTEMAKRQPPKLTNGQKIGKFHKLIFIQNPKANSVRNKLTAGKIIVNYPLTLSISSEPVQAAAGKAAVKALRAEAEIFLFKRLEQLARRHGYKYKKLTTKKLTGRWGSCDSKNNITLNLFLMQLPYELIDYVLLHELAHTKVPRHGRPFWDEMAKSELHFKELRKSLKAHQPALTVS